jgi:hypothetical protein
MSAATLIPDSLYLAGNSAAALASTWADVLAPAPVLVAEPDPPPEHPANTSAVAAPINTVLPRTRVRNLFVVVMVGLLHVVVCGSEV